MITLLIIGLILLIIGMFYMFRYKELESFIRAYFIMVAILLLLLAMQMKSEKETSISYLKGNPVYKIQQVVENGEVIDTIYVKIK